MPGLFSGRNFDSGEKNSQGLQFFTHSWIGYIGFREFYQKLRAMLSLGIKKTVEFHENFS